MKRIYLVFMATLSFLITLSCNSTVSAATSSDGYVWPIDVNSARSVYTSDFYNGHPAIDIAANVGTPIVAAKGGTVYCASAASTSSSAKCSRCGFTGAGYHVVIKQSDGKYAMYAHMSKVSVTTGASIATGKKIGEVGSTGISTGAHLHFGIYNAYSNGTINYNSFTEPLKVLTPFCNVYADNITNTSAVLHGQFGAISVPFASAGIYFGTSTENMTKITDSEASGFEFAYNNIESLYFNTATYCGQLQKGVTYYYQIWIVNSGKEYKSDIYRFTAGDKSSSAQVTDQGTYSVSWTDNINEISETNAKVGKICHLSGINNLSVSKVGIYLYDNNDNLLDSLTENTVNAGFAGESAVHIWYDIYNELGFSLSGGTTYKYKLMVEIDGKTHYSPVYSFTTKGCDHNYVYIGGDSATCTKSGESNYECSKCHAIDTVTVVALGHSFNTSYSVDKEATCLEEGSKSLHCKRCSAKKDAVVIPAKGHDWNDGVITTVASCSKEGVRTFSCLLCFESKTEAIPKTNAHVFTNNCDTTCNTCGYTRATTHSYKTTWEKNGAQHWHICSVCGASDEKVDHQFVNASDANCDICGYVREVVTTPPPATEPEESSALDTDDVDVTESSSADGTSEPEASDADGTISSAPIPTDTSTPVTTDPEATTAPDTTDAPASDNENGTILLVAILAAVGGAGIAVGTVLLLRRKK